MENSETLLDPSLEEENQSTANVVVGTMPALGKVTNLWLTGQVELEQAWSVS